MILQYFVTETATERKIPIEIDRATDADLAGTKSCWQTDWTSMFVYIEYIESHPDSNPTLVSHRKYVDIGRMMIAFGIQLSIDSGKNGVVTFEAKTDELARHYISDFGAVRIFSKQSGGPIMLMIADNAALTIFNTYLS